MKSKKENKNKLERSYLPQRKIKPVSQIICESYGGISQRNQKIEKKQLLSSLIPETISLGASIVREVNNRSGVYQEIKDKNSVQNKENDYINANLDNQQFIQFQPKISQQYQINKGTQRTTDRYINNGSSQQSEEQYLDNYQQKLSQQQQQRELDDNHQCSFQNYTNEQDCQYDRMNNNSIHTSIANTQRNISQLSQQQRSLLNNQNDNSSYYIEENQLMQLQSQQCKGSYPIKKNEYIVMEEQRNKQRGRRHSLATALLDKSQRSQSESINKSLGQLKKSDSTHSSRQLYQSLDVYRSDKYSNMNHQFNGFQSLQSSGISLPKNNQMKNISGFLKKKNQNLSQNSTKITPNSSTYIGCLTTNNNNSLNQLQYSQYQHQQCNESNCSNLQLLTKMRETIHSLQSKDASLRLELSKIKKINENMRETIEQQHQQELTLQQSHEKDAQYIKQLDSKLGQYQFKIDQLQKALAHSQNSREKDVLTLQQENLELRRTMETVLVNQQIQMDRIEQKEQNQFQQLSLSQQQLQQQQQFQDYEQTDQEQEEDEREDDDDCQCIECCNQINFQTDNEGSGGCIVGNSTREMQYLPREEDIITEKAEEEEQTSRTGIQEIERLKSEMLEQQLYSRPNDSSKQVNVSLETLWKKVIENQTGMTGKRPQNSKTITDEDNLFNNHNSSYCNSKNSLGKYLNSEEIQYNKDQSINYNEQKGYIFPSKSNTISQNKNNSTHTSRPSSIQSNENSQEINTNSINNCKTNLKKIHNFKKDQDKDLKILSPTCTILLERQWNSNNIPILPDTSKLDAKVTPASYMMLSSSNIPQDFSNKKFNLQQKSCNEDHFISVVPTSSLRSSFSDQNKNYSDNKVQQIINQSTQDQQQFRERNNSNFNLQEQINHFISLEAQNKSQTNKFDLNETGTQFLSSIQQGWQKQLEAIAVSKRYNTANSDSPGECFNSEIKENQITDFNEKENCWRLSNLQQKDVQELNMPDTKREGQYDEWQSNFDRSTNRSTVEERITIDPYQFMTSDTNNLNKNNLSDSKFSN